MTPTKIEELNALYAKATGTPIALPGAMARHAEAQELFMSEIVERWPEIYSALMQTACPRVECQGRSGLCETCPAR